MIALDLDNTIICYDDAFRAAAEETGCLPVDGITINKASVKASALAKGGNDLWTRLQGIAYASGIQKAKPFYGCQQFINRALDRNERLAIISHKTEYPAIGAKVNLRMAAINWLGSNGLSFGSRLPVIFCDSREEKVEHVRSFDCRALIDDLPDVFQTLGFPSSTSFILFDPAGEHEGWSASPRVKSWDEAADLLLPPPQMKPPLKHGGTSTVGSVLSADGAVPSSACKANSVQEEGSPFDAFSAAGALVKSLGHTLPVSVTPLPGGRNNQVWRVDCGHQSFLLKRYFWSEQDPRDRLGQEWAFLHYLRQIGCRQAPDPLVKDPAIRCALLEFIDGTDLEINDVTAKDVHAATDFFIQMNSQREKAASLPPVSEACFSLDAHIATMATRVGRLQEINPESDIHVAARDFVNKTIRPLWAKVENVIRSCSSLSRILTTEERCLSPSDFGFHNALRQADGCLRFLDFEYAGWDDPAKSIIDFCNQPDRLLPDDLADIFCERAIFAFPNPESLASRILLLEPLYQLKWACICLNNFLPGRTFTDPSHARSPEAQLARARLMAERAAERLDGEKGRKT